MEEHGTDQGEEHVPRWVPYTPPPPSGWDRVRMLARRLSFPLIVLLFLGGLAAAIYWGTWSDAPAESPAAVRVTPAAAEAAEGEDGPARVVQLSVRSTPVGAAVRINGDSIGTTPLTDRPIPSGVYMLSVRAPDHFRADTVIVLRDEAPATFRFTLRPRPGREAPAAAESPPPEPAEPRAERPLPVTSVPPAEQAPPSPPPAFGGLDVTSAPPGAVLSIDGTERGRTPVSLSRLSLGAKQLQLRLDGYEPWSAEIDVRPDTTRRVHAPLRAQTGRLRVLARPWGTIYIDGTLHVREADVWYETELPAGPHRVTAVHPALGQRTQEVQVRAGEEASVVLDLQAEDRDAPS